MLVSTTIPVSASGTNAIWAMNPPRAPSLVTTLIPWYSARVQPGVETTLSSQGSGSISICPVQVSARLSAETTRVPSGATPSANMVIRKRPTSMALALTSPAGAIAPISQKWVGVTSNPVFINVPLRVV